MEGGTAAGGNPTIVMLGAVVGSNVHAVIRNCTSVVFQRFFDNIQHAMFVTFSKKRQEVWFELVRLPSEDVG